MSEAPGIYLSHPDKPLQRKLTDKQWEMLAMICRTNGGGIDYSRLDKSVLRGLMRRHLVQGKAGIGSCVVHTREGLTLWREGRQP